MRGRALLERRKEMIKLRSQGVPLKEIVPDFTRKYQVSSEAIYIDWQKREQWIQQVVRLQDPSLIDEMLEGLKQVIPRAWFLYTTTQNDSIKIAALKLARDTYTEIIGLLQSLGIVVKMPDKLEVKEDVSFLLKTYEDAIERASNRNIHKDGIKQQVDSEASPATTT